MILPKRRPKENIKGGWDEEFRISQSDPWIPEIALWLYGRGAHRDSSLTRPLSSLATGRATIGACRARIARVARFSDRGSENPASRAVLNPERNSHPTRPARSPLACPAAPLPLHGLAWAPRC